MKKEIMQKLAELADILDSKGFLAEADAVDTVMKEMPEEELSNEEIAATLARPYASLPDDMIIDRKIIFTTDMDFGKMSRDEKETLEHAAEYIRRNSKIVMVNHDGPSKYLVILSSGINPELDILFLAAYRQFGFGGHITRLTPDKDGLARYVVTTNTLD
jgi:hypothetical protein